MELNSNQKIEISEMLEKVRGHYDNFAKAVEYDLRYSSRRLIELNELAKQSSRLDNETVKNLQESLESLVLTIATFYDNELYQIEDFIKFLDDIRDIQEVNNIWSESTCLSSGDVLNEKAKVMQKMFGKNKGALHDYFGIDREKNIPKSKIESEIKKLEKIHDKNGKYTKDELTLFRRLQSALRGYEANK